MSNYNETLDWCRDQSGELPVIRSRQDIDFLNDLTGYPADGAGIFLNADQMHNQSLSGHFFDWFAAVFHDDECQGSCCGLILRATSAKYWSIRTVDVCSDTRRRMVCRRHLLSALDHDATGDHVKTSMSATSKSAMHPLFVNLSHADEQERLAARQQQLLTSLTSVSQRLELMEQVLSESLAHADGGSGQSSDEARLRRLAEAGIRQSKFALIFLILVMTGMVAMQLAPLCRKVRRKRIRREHISLRDLVGRQA